MLCGLSSMRVAGQQTLVVRALLAVSILILLPLLSLAAAPFTGLVVDVLDGDSLLVKSGGKIYEVRLHGVDCPEWGQPFGQKAKARMSKFVGRMVKIVVHDVDRHGRLVAWVYLEDGRSLNLELIRQGLAWWYQRYAPNCRACRQAQREAQRARRGLWAGENPLPPWQWRREHEPPGRSAR